VFVPEVEIVHEKAAASRGASSRTIHIYYTSLRAFFAKHHAPRTPAPLRLVWYAGAYAKEALALAANAMRREKGLRY
jgi:GT2 family glycosyltransferase